MSTRVGIVDYGVGNIRSVANAILAIGAVPVLSSNQGELASCDRLILPGVGAFPHGMEALAARGLVGFLRDIPESGMPLLGICLGMQLLFEESTEFGRTDGLGIMGGSVDSFRTLALAPERIRLPNVGWRAVQITGRGGSLAASTLRSVTPACEFYFVHSFHVRGDNPNAAATSEFDDQRFAAIVAHGSVIGTQFHPEKSGRAGLQLLRNFVC